MSKKLLSILLSFALILSLVPVNIRAAVGPTLTVAKVSDGESFAPKSSVTMAVKLTNGTITDYASVGIIVNAGGSNDSVFELTAFDTTGLYNSGNLTSNIRTGKAAIEGQNGGALSFSDANAEEKVILKFTLEVRDDAENIYNGDYPINITLDEIYSNDQDVSSTFTVINGTITVTGGVDVKDPVISTQPTGATYVVGAANVASLSVACSFRTAPPSSQARSREQAMTVSSQ